MKKYYFISYRINIPNSTPEYGQELIDKTPLEYVIYWKSFGGDYGSRTILFAQEITESEYKLHDETINYE